MFIRSERLFLRPAWPEDWTEILTAICDEGVVRNLAKAPWPYTVEDAMHFARRPQQRMFPHFLITLPSSKGARVIGCIGLAEQDGKAELGYWIAREHWGRGYATEASRAVLRLARALGHQRIHAHHFADNPASGRVLAKVGFRASGEPTPRPSLARGGESLSIPLEAEIGADSDCNRMRLENAA